MNSSEDGIVVDAGSIDIVDVDICSDILASSVPEVALDEAQDLSSLLTRLAGDTNLLG